jgi:cob(I)alamin adenosyltransferase
VDGRRIPSWFQFLCIEAGLALTFIEIARARSNPETIASALDNARKALAKIQACLEKPQPHGLSEDEVVFLEKRCTEIALRLAGISD